MKFTRRRYQVRVNVSPTLILFPFQREWKIKGSQWTFSVTRQDRPEIPEAFKGDFTGPVTSKSLA